MKKVIIALILLALSVGTFSCGGGAGSADKPKGENPGTPSVVQLSPSQFVAQTNTVITLHAKVLDGNGAPVANRRVTFTNLSSIGVLSSTTAETGDAGIATVTLKSTTDGFSTVQAEVNKAVGQVRDRKTVFFSSVAVGQPALLLDLTVGSGDPFAGVTVTATVFDGFGRLVSNIDVTFGSDSTEATFPLGNTATTDINGQASVLVKVVPSELRPVPTVINITALAYNGAFNMVSLILPPVTISNVQVFANPQTVASGGDSTIIASVTTTAGTSAPDGTTVNFTVSANGSVDTPFAQTTGGMATAKFTAATVTSNSSATITASAGGRSGSTTINITAPVIPVATTVTSTTPANDATGVTRNSDITIRFSANIDCTTVSIAKAPSTAASITVSSVDTDDAYLVKSCSGSTAVFTASNQNLNTLYSVTVTNKVKDLAGNAVVALTFSYTTAP